MARWLVIQTTHAASPIPSFTALLTTLLFFCVCVTLIVALCAGANNPRLLPQNSEPKLGNHPAMDHHSRKLSSTSQRFSGASIQSKLVSSFRKAPSFRIDCTQTSVEVVDSLQMQRSSAGVEESNLVWQRAILRGERCAPLRFSGLVLYDEKGNHLPAETSTLL